MPNKLLELAAEREPAIVLTAPWHERDARALAERLNDVVLWIESHRAVVSGDTLADFGDGIAVQPE